VQVCTSLQTDNHANTPPISFLQAGCPSCRPTNSVKALKAISNGDKLAFTFMTGTDWYKCGSWLLCLEFAVKLLIFVVLKQQLLQQRETEASFVYIIQILGICNFI